MNTWKENYQKELVQAEIARTSGNEGRARVCARRAAGVVIAEYFQRQKIPVSNASVYALLQLLIVQPEISETAREAAEHLLMRVTSEHHLPIEIDLLAEASRLASELSIFLPQE